MLVLLVSIVVAMLMRSSNHQSIENAIADRSLSSDLAKSGADYLIGQIRGEIITNSVVSSLDGVKIYTPNADTNMVPSRQLRNISINTDTNFLNLVKQTATTFGGGSSVSTDVASRDGRTLSPNRWNVPKLVSGSGFSSADTLPTWTYLSRAGIAASPSAVTASMKDPASDSFIIGRFAANIYTVDGLIDVNVAGYASAASDDATRKGSLVWADLSALPGTDSSALTGNGGLPQWRFTGPHTGLLALISGNGAGVDAASGEPGGWLTPNTGGSSTSQDNRISSRQELLKMASLGTYGFTTNTAPYLTHWSRSLVSPSFQPNPDRPKVLPLSQGGNDAVGRDDEINPSLVNTRVTKPFVRRTYDPRALAMRDRVNRDGTLSNAVVGEPFLKFRFPLSNLGLLTREATAVADETVPIHALFGLSRSSTSDAWTYDHGSPTGAILKLSEVAALGREPDFVELLKASITVGSLGKSSGLQWQMPEVRAIRDNLDQSVDYQIIQIAANIIDQADADGYPTKISFNGMDFHGIENLPYLTGARVISPGWRASANGVALSKMLIQPEVWNPHEPINLPTDRPTNFRVVAEANGVLGLSSYNSDSGFLMTVRKISEPDNWEITSFNGYYQYHNITPSNSEILFSEGSGAFSEPTFLSAANASPGGGNIEGFFQDRYQTYYPGNVLGIYVGLLPEPGWTQFQGGASPGVGFKLEYQDGSQWITYYDPGDMDLVNNFMNHWAFGKFVFTDPRTGRFGAAGGAYTPSTNPPGYTYPADQQWDPGQSSWPQLSVKRKVWSWLPATALEMAARGWTFNLINGMGSYWGDISQNILASNTRYKDADGQVRPAMGSYAVGNNGLPMSTGNASSRPIILNRPFRSIGELGYVFKGTPWKNLDFSSVESGDSALLDVFSIYDAPDTALVTGRINPNTASIPALTAVIQGTLRDEASATSKISNADATAVATAIRTFVTSTNGGPLKSKAELVGKYISSGYTGVASTMREALPPADAATERCRLTAIRSLGDVTEVRTWSLMIDVIAQTGRFSPQTTNLGDFSVTGESRRWVFVALDRITGEIVDMSTEQVVE